MKACKVITTCFEGRTVREKTTKLGNPKGYYNHSQNFPTSESVVELIKLIVEQDKIVDPGVPCDTIIVNNDIGYKDGNDYLESINGEKLHSGKIIILNRENYGRSFGGYNYAFEQLRDKYDYWIFTEDDILINGDKYFKKSINKFIKNANNGFVALQNISNENYAGICDDENLHAHGGVGITSTKILSELYKSNGCLPHCGKDDSQSYSNIITNGEIMFTNKINKLGYNLCSIKKKLYVYAYDYIKEHN